MAASARALTLALYLPLALVACGPSATGEDVEASEGAFVFGGREDLAIEVVDFGRPTNVPSRRGDAVFTNENELRRYFGRSCEEGKPAETAICVRPMVGELPADLFGAPEGKQRAVIFASRPEVPLGSELVVKRVTQGEGPLLTMELCTRETQGFARSYAMVKVDVDEDQRDLSRVLVRSTELAPCD